MCSFVLDCCFILISNLSHLNCFATTLAAACLASMLVPGNEQYMGDLGLPPIDAGVLALGSSGWRVILSPPLFMLIQQQFSMINQQLGANFQIKPQLLGVMAAVARQRQQLAASVPAVPAADGPHAPPRRVPGRDAVDDWEDATRSPPAAPAGAPPPTPTPDGEAPGGHGDSGNAATPWGEDAAAARQRGGRSGRRRCDQVGLLLGCDR